MKSLFIVLTEHVLSICVDIVRGAFERRRICIQCTIDWLGIQTGDRRRLESF